MAGSYVGFFFGGGGIIDILNCWNFIHSWTLDLVESVLTERGLQQRY